MIEIPWGTVVSNPLLAAFIVIGWLQYSMRYGKLGEHLDMIESAVSLLIRISHEVPGVDEEKVEAEFNGSDSTYYIKEVKEDE